MSETIFKGNEFAIFSYIPFSALQMPYFIFDVHVIEKMQKCTCLYLELKAWVSWKRLGKFMDTSVLILRQAIRAPMNIKKNIQENLKPYIWIYNFDFIIESLIIEVIKTYRNIVY